MKNKKLYIFGNFKMNKDKQFFNQYFESLNNFYNDKTNYIHNVTIFTPSPYFYLYQNDYKFNLGSQNMYFKNSGAYTGEIGIDMLNDFNIKYCLVGHSERREYFKEDGTMLNQKLICLQQNSVMPILCIGESLDTFESGNTNQFLINQLDECLDNVDINNLIVAYEPIWAIGTGKVATSSQANDVIQIIKTKLSSMGSKNPIVLYGGSVNKDNAQQILSQPSIDGALIGGACMDFDQFKNILEVNV